VARTGLRHTVLGRSYECRAGRVLAGAPRGAEVLAPAVARGADPQPGESAVDLYAGVGLFAALVGERVGEQGSVLAVESDPRACADAARNTADLPQVRIRTARWMQPRCAASARRTWWSSTRPQRPRHPGREALADLRPRRLAYVSCDAASFARDLRVLLEAGWGARGAARARPLPDDRARRAGGDPQPAAVRAGAVTASGGPGLRVVRPSAGRPCSRRPAAGCLVRQGRAHQPAQHLGGLPAGQVLALEQVLEPRLAERLAVRPWESTTPSV
jgi:hypothetical protein